MIDLNMDLNTQLQFKQLLFQPVCITVFLPHIYCIRPNRFCLVSRISDNAKQRCLPCERHSYIPVMSLDFTSETFSPPKYNHFYKTIIILYLFKSN